MQAGNFSGPTIDQMARRHGVSKDRLGPWLTEIFSPTNSIPSVPLSFFEGWKLLADCPDDVFDYHRAAVFDRLKAINNIVPPSPKYSSRHLAQFENQDFDGWQAIGTAFGSGPERNLPFGTVGYVGHGVASSFHGDNSRTGRLLSFPINVSKPNSYLSFRIAGGTDREKTYVRLILSSPSVDLSEIRMSPKKKRRIRLLCLWRGFSRQKEVCLEVVDDDESSYIMIDDVVLTDGFDHRDVRDASHIRVPSMMLDVLKNSQSITPVSMGQVYADQIISVLDEWQHQFNQYIDNRSYMSTDVSTIPLVRPRLPEISRDEIAAWMLKADSLLLPENELVYFLSPEDQKELKSLRLKKSRLEAQSLSSSIAIVTKELTPKDIAIEHRGNPRQKGKTVPRGYISILCPTTLTEPPIGSGRENIAQWLTSSENPLTARVFVNRIWQHHFGEAIVRTPDDFGHRGEPPTHPELLDYLARELMDRGWSLKAMHRLMMSSATYRQSSNETSKAHEVDPDNKFLSHMPKSRLECELIYDSLLSVSGSLDLQMYGKSIPVQSSIAAVFGMPKPMAEVNQFQLDENGEKNLSGRAYLLHGQAFVNSSFAHDLQLSCSYELRRKTIIGYSPPTIPINVEQPTGPAMCCRNV